MAPPDVAVDGTLAGGAWDMDGARVPGFQVVGRAPTPEWKTGACWWLRCDGCGAERWETGNMIRKAAKGGRWVVWCRGCGAYRPWGPA